MVVEAVCVGTRAGVLRGSGGAAARCRAPARVVRAHGRTKEREEIAATESAEDVTRKFGLEAGLLKTVSRKDVSTEDKVSTAKDLLARYGSAYLATSITLSLISFGTFYALIDSGVDVAALLAKFGIEVSATSEKVGTAALAYAAHKAASPIRFPPTVALTPVVAQLLGKKPKEGGERGGGQQS